jgi:hypothetical protein
MIAPPVGEKIDHGRAPLPVEIVRWFIQQQEVRFHEDERSKAGPRALSARHCCQAGLRFHLKPEAGKSGSNPALKHPIGIGKFVGIGFAALGAAKKGQCLGNAEEIRNGFGWIGLNGLAKDTQGVIHGDRAGVRAQFARNQLEKGGFPGGIAADKARSLRTETQINTG